MNKLQRVRLDNAFDELTKIGYFAKQNHTCCNTCGWAEIPAGQKAVFYHNQSADDLRKDSECYLNWDGNASEIMAVFNKYGISTSWDGSSETKIFISVPKD